MKKITIVIVACIIALTACKKDNNTKYYMSASIDGEVFYTDTLYNNDEGVSCVKQNANPGYLRIRGMRLMSHYDGIQFLMDTSYSGTGTYDLKVISNRYNYYIAPNGGEWRVGSVDSASSGTLTITSDTNNVIQGIFVMNVQQTTLNGPDTDSIKYITSGKFSIPITYR